MEKFENNITPESKPDKNNKEGKISKLSAVAGAALAGAVGMSAPEAVAVELADWQKEYIEQNTGRKVENMTNMELRIQKQGLTCVAGGTPEVSVLDNGKLVMKCKKD